MSAQSSHTVIICIISLMLHVCSSQLQQQVQFFPINNWNCGDETAEKICAVDTASEMLETSSLTECTMHCWMKLPECLQFNYYDSSPETPSNCSLYNFRPKNYFYSSYAGEDCQHYVVNTLTLYMYALKYLHPV